MNNKDFMKYCLEIVNQEYNGDLQLFYKDLEFYGLI